LVAVFVVHVMTADVLLGDETTLEITGAVTEDGLTVTVAVAYFVVSATLVARTLNCCCVETEEGAV
jgi:hypothetical protein